MASKTQKTEKIRHRKARANKTNVKAETKRLQNNHEVLQRIAGAKS